MKFLLDTNVVSELRKGERADSGVRDWFAAVEGSDLALSVLVLAEIRLGILRLARRDPDAASHLSTWAVRVERAYGDRILAIDQAVGAAWAGLNAQRTLPVIDGLQAATARVYGLTFVTRNVRDFEGIKISLLNPFSADR